ncbi:MAG TPA: acyl-CoA dehydrogenase family protein [Candidatus Binataceae bacterium]|nr:acyl-CoA dehydrogenase family protein [Candidatus Binataceae bacterium]
MINYEEFDSAIGLNWYEIDPDVQQVMRRMLDPVDLEWCEPELIKFGALCGGAIASRAETTDKHPPELTKFDRWGEAVDRVVHHPTAIATKRDLWESGMSGPRLRKEAARRGRRYPAAMATALDYMVSQAEIAMLCATGMTSGVIALVQRYAPDEIKEGLLSHLTADSFDDAWDGAMFMTERTGGSDLSTIATSAREDGGRWILNGAKWFCSNIDAGVIVTLARPEGAAEGLKGIALFVVPKVRADGSRNGIEIRRLKNKLGTRAVPTAEADFVNAEAYLLSGGAKASDGRGLNRMMEMVNGSRLGVAAMGLGIMRRSFLEAAIFAAHRQAKGRLLQDLPMMRETLVGMLVELEAAAALVFAVTDGGAISRLLAPLAKMRVTRRGIELASQALEIHGGNGYIEDWPTARQLRDAQCNTIWEGTENIICLDILRALRDEQVLEAVFASLQARIDGVGAELAPIRETVTQSWREVRDALSILSRADRDLAQMNARRFCGYMADVAQASLLLEAAQWELSDSGNARKAVVARLFAEEHLSATRGRPIVSSDRTRLDLFVPLTRYGFIEPSQASGLLRRG